MNHIHTVLWNPALGHFCVTSELGRSRSRATTRRNAGSGLQTRLPALAVAVALACAMPAWSQAVLPQGANVVSGNVQIREAGNQLTVQQGSAKAIVDWQSFNIGKGQQVTFQQPSASSVALNRVIGADASAIHGSLQANGKVFLVNPNGVLFGQGANVNVGGLVASTLNISNERFLNGNYQFEGKGSAVQGSTVTNQGHITAAEGGAVALLGGTVSNQGTIVARLGSVALAAGNQVSLDFAGDGLLDVQVQQSALDALAENQQLLHADGGSVLIAAKATDALLQTVVNNTGTVQARTVENREGRIVLLGGFNGGTAQVAGTLDASAPEGGNGGFIETSGAHVKIVDSASITTRAPQGRGGTWLIDPNDFTVAGSGGDMTGRQVQEALNQNGTLSIETATMGTAGGQGDIHINDNIGWGSGTLELNAERNINVNAILSFSGTGKLDLYYGGSASSTGLKPADGTNLNVSGRINLGQTATRAPSDRLKINGVGYTVIRSMSELQKIADNPAGYYALGNSIDASGFAGFVPIGGESTPFMGTFDGLGHQINSLDIRRRDGQPAGLFGYAANATLRNVGLVDLSVIGLDTVGGLVGSFIAQDGRTASISNAYATGYLSAGTQVGGLVGSVIAKANSGTSISNVHASVDVTGDYSLGGLIGDHRSEGGTAILANAHASGNVQGKGFIGGLVGSQKSDGGWAGIFNAYASTNVKGIGYVGGLVGEQNLISGVAGISNAYATGAVQSESRLSGGLVGQPSSGGVIIDSYWNSETTGQASTGAGTALTTAQMLEPGRWGGFAFGTVWGNANGRTTPYLLGMPGNQVFLDSDVLARKSITADNRPHLYTAVLDLIQLHGMRGKLNGKYLLGSDIDARATANWDNGRGFMPIGSESAPFRGVFDGLGHHISGLSIHRPELDSVGLFGSTDSATLRNVGLVDVSVTGKNMVGGLAGRIAYTHVSNAFATGNVSGVEQVGGLVGKVSYLDGYNSLTSISNAYATANVAGEKSVGGLVGSTSDTEEASISNAYATGKVTGKSDVGGLLGFSSRYTSISDSYWNSQTTGQTASAGGGTALTTDQMFDSSSWVGFGSGNAWNNANGQTTPYLLGMSGNQVFNRNEVPAQGTSTADNRPPLYTVILDATELQAMQGRLDGKYLLGNDIDASATATWDGGRGFMPIGDRSSPFSGSFDGLSHVISGLAIHRPDRNFVGLFGYAENAALRNVSLMGSVKGADFTGALVGSIKASGASAASISNVVTTVEVVGQDNVGGLVGMHESFGQGDASIVSGQSLGQVTGRDNVGGLVGMQMASNKGTARISRAYTNNIWVMEGRQNVGGLVGLQSALSGGEASLTDSETSLAVQGTGYAGRLIGQQQIDGTGWASVSNVTAADIAKHEPMPMIGKVPDGNGGFGAEPGNITAGGAMSERIAIYASIEDSTQSFDTDGDSIMASADGCSDEGDGAAGAFGAIKAALPGGPDPSGVRAFYAVVGGLEPAAVCSRSIFSSP